MKNLIFISIIVITVLLTACSNEEVVNDRYTFIGEGAYWEAEYVFESEETQKEKNGRTTYSTINSDVFTLSYKGDVEEMQTIEKIEYNYKTSAGEGSGSREFDEPPTDITLRSNSSDNGAKVYEDEIIPVIVKWDGLEETFELLNKSE
ncbi:hypothetical protein BpOF4_20999 (plasmid) [Alkalihalophilus pseudofirmus OF4]|uniref:Lipoprotein n=1 Tax=Alkalihalophilus pseudofirmus (strain ATCC BAA-2126 / JCM 17055 / OF4) TaxID=398511 RepID=D3G1G9_ALKPO|nr:hypothetical protein [Alkalihalophilus pseudofirmus]ADC52195.1 hypothetical protein BpOF4_20999 [Alkalihalophilus pseudofirmus OF4]